MKYEKKRVKITRSHESWREQYPELQWTPKERRQLEKRILSLRNDQIAALLNLVGLGFSKKDIDHIVSDIRNFGSKSGHLPILTDEADSKENLLWWVNYFEEANKS